MAGREFSEHSLNVFERLRLGASDRPGRAVDVRHGLEYAAALVTRSVTGTVAGSYEAGSCSTSRRSTRSRAFSAASVGRCDQAWLNARRVPFPPRARRARLAAAPASRVTVNWRSTIV